MAYKSLLIAVALCLCISTNLATAQVPAIVTGVVYDAGGNLATSGTVAFAIQPNSSGIQYYVQGVGVIANPSTTCAISNTGTVVGITGSGNCTVWGNDVISPANTTYTVTYFPNGTQTLSVPQFCISGSSANLNMPTFCPVVQVIPQYNTITTSPIQSNIVPGSNKVFTLGNAQAYYSAGYVSNLFTNSLFMNNVACTNSTPFVQYNGTCGAGGSFVNPLTTLGDMLYGGTAGALTRLPGNTSVTTLCLQQTGTGSISAPPVWGPCSGITGLALSSITAATQPNSISNGDNSQTWFWSPVSSAYSFGILEATPAANSGDLVEIGTNPGSLYVPLYIFQTLTGSGNVTAVSINPTWNTTATVDGAFEVNVTNTNSGPGSNLANFKVNGTPIARLDKLGNFTIIGGFSGAALQLTGSTFLGSTQCLQVNSAGIVSGTSAPCPGTGITWPSAGQVVISNATNSPNGVAPINGDCLVGVGGAWVATTCPAGGGGTAFNTITSGTNIAATMNVGTGASINITGSGQVQSSSIGTSNSLTTNAPYYLGGFVSNSASQQVPTLDGSTFFISTGSGLGSFNTQRNFNITSATAATSGSNVNSPIFTMIANYWNGTTSTQDSWAWQISIGSGTNPPSTLTLTHAGASFSPSVSIPYALTSASYFGVLVNGVTATTQSSGDNSTKVATTAYVDRAPHHWSCQPGGLGDGTNAVPANTYLQTACYNDTGSTVTITGLKCFTDNAGSSTMNASGHTLGSLLTGAVTCSASWAAGTQSANVALTSGDWINFTFVADGTTKQTSWLVSGTY